MPCALGHDYSFPCPACQTLNCWYCRPDRSCSQCGPGGGMKRPPLAGTRDDDSERPHKKLHATPADQLPVRQLLFQQPQPEPEEPAEIAIEVESEGVPSSAFRLDVPFDPEGQIFTFARKAVADRARNGSRRHSRSLSTGPVHRILAAREIGNEFRIRNDSSYAFVHKIERLKTPGMVEVHFECTDATWMDTVWLELLGMGAAPHLSALLLHYPYRKSFVLAEQMLHRQEQTFLHTLYMWFVARTWLEGEEAEGGYWTLVMPEDALADAGVEESSWFTMTLTDNPFLAAAEGEWVRMALDPADDPEPTQRWLVRDTFRRVPQVSDQQPKVISLEALQMLHYPRTAPPPLPPIDPFDQMDRVHQGDVEMTFGGGDPTGTLLRVRGGVEALGARARASLDALRAAVVRGLRDLADRLVGGGGALGAPALAGGGALDGRLLDGGDDRPPVPRPTRAPRAPELTPPAPMAYVGGDGGGAGAGNVPQPPNPMVQGLAPHDRQPFLGSIDIGQGNCSALFDNQGHAIVYYDLGSRVNGDDPTDRVHPRLCFCHNPTVILSHWDKDHFIGARYQADSFRQNWVVPQQHMGGLEVRDIIAQVLRHNGHMHLWTNMRGTMTFPWGFLVRSEGPLADQFVQNKKNDVGLSMYVCVKDTPGVNTAVPNVPVVCGTMGVGAAVTPAQLAAHIDATYTNNTFGTNATSQRPFIEAAVARRVILALRDPLVGALTVREKAVLAMLIVQLEKVGAAAVTNTALGHLARATMANYANKVARDGAAGAQIADATAAADRVADVIEQKSRYGVPIPATFEACVDLWKGTINGKTAVTFAKLVERALGGPAPAALVLSIQTVADVAPTTPPVDAGERYLVTTGDGPLQLSPAQRFATPPTTVGQAAFHHGSNMSDSIALLPDSIPWAFNSRQARGCAAIHAAPAPGTPALIAARAVAVFLLDDTQVPVVDGLHAAVLADHSNHDEGAIFAAARSYHPTLTWAAAQPVIAATPARASTPTSTANDVLTDAGILGVAITPALTAVAEAGLAFHRQPAGGVAGAQTMAGFDAHVESTLAAMLPTLDKGEFSDDQIATSRAGVLAVGRTHMDRAVPDQAKVSAALAAAAGGPGATALRQLSFTATVYATLAARAAGAAAIDPVAQGALNANRETQATRRAVAHGIVAAGAAMRVAGHAFPVQALMDYVTLVSIASPTHRGQAVHAVGTVETPADPMLYTFGTNNTFHHPMAAATQKYVAHGWTRPLNRHHHGTVAIDYAIGWEVDLAAGYEGPLRGDGGGFFVDRTADCAGCHGVKRFRVRW